MKNHFKIFLILLIFRICQQPSFGADFYGKTVEVYNTGGIGLKAWTDTCSGTYVNKPDGTRGIVLSILPSMCGGFNRWKIKWPNDSVERWSAEDYLKIVPPDLSVFGSIKLTPSYVPVGGTIVVSCTLTNLGAGRARASGTDVGLLLNSPVNMITNVQHIETFEVESHSTTNFSFDFVIPKNVTPGTYFFQVEVDGANTISQTYYDNDLKESARFSIIAANFNVTAIASKGGQVSPNSTQSVPANGNITFSAIPDEGKEVDQWLVDGIVRQTGQSSFTLKGVTNNAAIQVAFKDKMVKLEIGGATDDIEVFINGNKAPTTSVYNLVYGTDVRIRKILVTALQFVDHWFLQNGSGSITIPGNSIWTTLVSDTAIQAFLDSVRPSSPLTGGLSGGQPSLVVPASGTASDEIVRQVQRSHDLVCWLDYDINPPEGPLVVAKSPCSFGAEQEGNAFFRVLKDVKVHTEPILLFPIPGKSATNVRVTSLLDHCNADKLKAIRADGAPDNSWLSGVIGAYSKDEMFMTYKGEILCGGNSEIVYEENRPNFRISGVLARPLDLNYVGGSLIGYSGHPGYDYGVSGLVLAAEKGVVIPNLSGGYENRLFIEHEHLGLATCYLHLRAWAKELLDHSDTAPGSTRFNYAKRVNVEKGFPIGIAGGAGISADGNWMVPDRYGVHLHLETYRVVIRDNIKYYVLMDPYGAYTSSGKQVYGTSWLPSETPLVEFKPENFLP